MTMRTFEPGSIIRWSSVSSPGTTTTRLRFGSAASPPAASVGPTDSTVPGTSEPSGRVMVTVVPSATRSASELGSWPAICRVAPETLMTGVPAIIEPRLTFTASTRRGVDAR